MVYNLLLLQDPGSAIPKGTLLAIGITFVTYIVYPFMLAGSVIRDASGNHVVYVCDKLFVLLFLFLG